MRRIGAFSRKLGEPTTEAGLLQEIARQAAAVAAGSATVLIGDGDRDAALLVRAGEPSRAEAALDEGGKAAALRCWTHGEATGRGMTTLPGGAWRFMPLRTARGRLAVLGVCLGQAAPAPRLQALDALADQAAVALGRVRLAAQSARVEAFEETQRLRTAFAVRADLLSSIEHDVGRMSRFLANIMELTRLESGEIKPRIQPAAVGEVIEAAIARVPGAAFAPVSLPQPALAASRAPEVIRPGISPLDPIKGAAFEIQFACRRRFVPQAPPLGHRACVTKPRQQVDFKGCAFDGVQGARPLGFLSSRL